MRARRATPTADETGAQSRDPRRTSESLSELGARAFYGENRGAGLV